MRAFSYYQPTDVRFGAGRVEEVGRQAARFGRRCLLVTAKAWPGVEPLYQRVQACLRESGVETWHFDDVQPNPTTDTITAGAAMAREHGVEVVIGLGGGSSMDAAKAIAVAATHPGTVWDYLFYKSPQPDLRTLPVVAVTTTSGTGSQVTQVAVVTNTACRDKSALYNAALFPRVAIVDPELMVSAPPHLTAATGFDAFTHAFESVLHSGSSPLTELMAFEAIRLVVRHLPAAMGEGGNLEARAALAWADTLAGLCIANAGVTLPHGIGMAIGGMFPHVMHGEALAVVYPAVMRHTWRVDASRFARLACVLDRDRGATTELADAERCVETIDAFLHRIGMHLTLQGLKVPRAELPALARQSLVLPDYKNHPKIVDEQEVREILEESFAA